MDGELSPLDLQHSVRERCFHAYRRMDEWKSFSGLSSIIPDPTNLTDYKP